MNDINQTIVNQSFTSGARQDGQAPDEVEGFELHAEHEDGAAQYGAQEFSHDIVDGEFEPLEEQKQKISIMRLMLFVAPIALLIAGGAMYAAKHYQSQQANEPDFASLKASVPAVQPAPAPAPAPAMAVAVAEATSQGPAIQETQAPAPAIGPQDVSTQAAATPASHAVPGTAQAQQGAPTPAIASSSAPSIQTPAPQIESPKQPLAAPAKQPAATPTATAAAVATPILPAKEVKLEKVAAQPKAKAEVQIVKKTDASISLRSEKKEKSAGIAHHEIEQKRTPTRETRIESAAGSMAGVINDVKPLVTVTANQIGLKSMTTETLLIASGATSQQFRVGDYLPNGEQLLFIDSQAATIVTDKKIIRVAN